MIELLFQNIFDGLLSFVGSSVIVALLVMGIFLGLAMLLGLPFDFALLLTMPIPYALQRAGFLDVWVSGLLIVVFLGFSSYLIWVRFQSKM